MKKIFILIVLLFVISPVEIRAEKILGVTVVSSDVSSYPGGGTLDATKAIASYHNWGLRMYFVDAKTGERFGIVRDFISSTPYSLSSYYYYGGTKKDLYKSSNLSLSSLKKSYQNFVTVKSSYYGQSFPTDPGKGLDSSKTIEDFFTKLYLTKANYGNNPKIENALQVFLLEQLKVPASKVETVVDTTVTPEYYVMVEPVRYFKILNGYYALSATESALVITANNFGTSFYNGVDVRHPFWNDGFQVLYEDIIPTGACLDKIATGTMPNDNTSSVLTRCKSINWWLARTITSYTPKSVVHDEQHVIGGVTYNPFKNKASYSRADVIGINEGLGLGFVNVSEFFIKTVKACKDMTKAEIFDNLPRCCTDPRAVDAPNYKAACPVPDDSGDDPGSDPSTCNYYVNAKYPTSCSITTEGRISDINDWSCIFKSETLGGADYSDHYVELTNRYCSVYCREDIEYKFPNSSFTVLAGNHFTVGSKEYGSGPQWNPVFISGNATCRTNGIDYDKFTTDWNAANTLVKSSWNELQKEIAREKSVTDSKIETDSTKCNCINNTTNFSCCESEKAECSSGLLVNGKCQISSDPVKTTQACSSPLVGGICKSCPAGFTPSGTKCISTTATCVTGKPVGTKCIVEAEPTYSCTKENNTKYDYYKPANSYYAGTNYQQGEFCSNSFPTFSVNSLRNTYNQAVSTRDSYLTTINQCTSFEFDYSDLLPRLQLSYEEAKYGRSLELVPNYEDESSTKLINQSTGTVRIANCNTTGSICTETNLDFVKADDILHQAKRVVNYSLDTDVYRYVEKISGLSMNIIPFSNYLDVGYGNLPIDYSRAPGSYDISLMYGSLGSDNKFNDFILKGIDNTPVCPGTYDCSYNVINRVVCTPGSDCTLKNLGVIFRPISLSKPFPGIEGESREPGTNWNGYTNLITNNRGVVGDSLYRDRKPMYEITLDTLTIKKIRAYNSKNSYTDFDLVCKDGTARECVSNFLTNLRSGTSESTSLKINSCARTGNKWNDTCKIGG